MIINLARFFTLILGHVLEMVSRTVAQHCELLKYVDNIQ